MDHENQVFLAWENREKPMKLVENPWSPHKKGCELPAGNFRLFID